MGEGEEGGKEPGGKVRRSIYLALSAVFALTAGGIVWLEGPAWLAGLFLVWTVVFVFAGWEG